MIQSVVQWTRRMAYIVGAAVVTLVVLGWGAFAVLKGPTGPGIALRKASADDGPLLVPPPPFINGEAAVLIDADSGKLLYAKNAFERFPPGSLVKPLAALTALRRGELTDEVRVGAMTSSFAGLTYGFQEGEEFFLGDLIALMLYRPENDPAVAVAMHIAGSIDAFSRQMNAEARRIGATMSRFADLSGSIGNGPNSSYTTAFDLAWIGRDALEDERFARIVRTPRTRLSRRGGQRTVFNINSFLIRRPDATGIKTAYIPDMGYSLIGSIQQDGRRLVVVVLASPSPQERYYDAVSLLEYGLAHFEGLLAEPRVDRIAYEVQAGDTLSGLAARFSVPIVAILTANSMVNPDSLRSGETIWIPR